MIGVPEPMRIENLRRETDGERTRIEARYTWEDAGLEPYTVYYEADSPLAGALEATPEAFAALGFPLALWEGERRLRVEGALDAALAAGLEQARRLLADWYGRCGSLDLEPTGGFRTLRPLAEPRTVALFSGGVDALAMLCENRRIFPLDHPRSIRTVVHAFGFSFLDRPEGEEEDPRMRARYEAQLKRVERLGERLAFEVVRVETNMRRLDPHRDPYYNAAYGGAFLAPLISAPAYVSDALIASAGTGGSVPVPHGSHPMLDVHYSTSAVRVTHVQGPLPRPAKLRMLADWEPAYDVLQVCHGFHDAPPGKLNCGHCEKCVRTMLGLIANGALERFTTFPETGVTPDLIDAIHIRHKHAQFFDSPELYAALERAGRHDLVRAIRNKIRYLGPGRLARMRHRLRRSVAKRIG